MRVCKCRYDLLMLRGWFQEVLEDKRQQILTNTKCAFGTHPQWSILNKEINSQFASFDENVMDLFDQILDDYGGTRRKEFDSK